MNKISVILTSRKFWAAIVALGFAFFGDRAGLDQQTTTEAVYVAISYIIGQGLADSSKK